MWKAFVVAPFVLEKDAMRASNAWRDTATVCVLTVTCLLGPQVVQAQLQVGEEGEGTR